ncbi:MAG TPA: PEP-CTERM-box response regulator transcription factor [Syntrophales bacterium]|nr:PEP-CTERM-box response regulator transcription factor [Syntrophales bacterium]HPQ44596.1 PEP-CTERM-box response regulator transcription factor [Syntrophales bacterium]
MEKPKLLIVDDDENLRTQMKWALTGDYEVLLAEDRSTALNAVEGEKPAVVTLDLGLPPKPAGVEEGFAALADILAGYPQTKVIIITGRGEKEHALQAVGQGAYDFFYKPIEIEELKVVLRRAFYVSQLEHEHREAQRRLSGDSFEGILGTSTKMQEVFTTIRKIATTDVPVLIGGESGTGKELVAGAIHQLSPRKNAPFIVINCGAIPENLLESELFGHEKGAFTGAHIQRKGRFELADGGSLFLDEIGELSLPLQVKLLRFLEDQVVERIGGRKGIEVDVRIIAATNRDLKRAMKDGSFREDLYFRLSVVSISLPPLREREGDILLLAKSFLNRYAEENRKKVTGFTREACAAIERYEWSGNVRELENRIKRAVIMSEGIQLTPADLEMEVPKPEYDGLTLKEARETLEKELIKKALFQNQGNITKASQELGISRPTLYDLMERFGISTG